VHHAETLAPDGAGEIAQGLGGTGGRRRLRIIIRHLRFMQVNKVAAIAIPGQAGTFVTASILVNAQIRTLDTRLKNVVLIFSASLAI
jgi:hypothetical protein